jgi:two-component system response regulator FlrC
MADVFIHGSNFSGAAALEDLLWRRRVSVDSSNPQKIPGLALGHTATGSVHTWVCSDTYEHKKGGRRSITEFARIKGARRIVVVHENAEQMSISYEMADRLVRVFLPPRSSTGPAILDAGLLLMAEIVASPQSAMVTVDDKSRNLLDLANRVARSDVTAFIGGPTGSGKEVLARQIHFKSRRADKAFVAINCAAIPENMLEAVLFGHEKGAFTGASTANSGIIRAAEGGTLLLDEISEMPMGLQAKLLRVLQERTVTPLGSQKEIAIDVRIIATSNRDMPREVAERHFREDLYYRLNVFPLQALALVDRRDDIAALAVALILRHIQGSEGLPVLCDDAIELLLSHDWPGNVRELENVIQRALVLQERGRITGADIIFDPSIKRIRLTPEQEPQAPRPAIAL